MIIESPPQNSIRVTSQMSDIKILYVHVPERRLQSLRTGPFAQRSLASNEIIWYHKASDAMMHKAIHVRTTLTCLSMTQSQNYNFGRVAQDEGENPKLCGVPAQGCGFNVAITRLPCRC